MSADEATRAGQPGMEPLRPVPADGSVADGTVAGGRPASWIGRATPPQPPPPPFADPYWPPVEGLATHQAGSYRGLEGHVGPDYGAGYPVPVRPRRRRSGRSALLVTAGVVAACCAGGATTALLGTAVVKGLVHEAARSGGTDSGGAGQAGPGEDASNKDAPSKDGKDGSGRHGGDATGPGLNTPVRDGKFEFIVSSTSCGHDTVGHSIIKTKAKGQFCVVNLSITNIGDEAQTFTDVFQTAVGPDGTVYRADSGAGLIANEGGGVFWKVINPGITVTGKIVYDIPEDASIASLELHDSVLSGGVTVNLA